MEIKLHLAVYGLERGNLLVSPEVDRRMDSLRQKGITEEDRLKLRAIQQVETMLRMIRPFKYLWRSAANN